MDTSYFFKILIAVIMITGTNGKAQKRAEAKKVLVAYFSWSGNTRTIAKQIQEVTGGELFEIQTTRPYPQEYRPCTEVAKKEQQADIRPELKTKVGHIENYDLIFIGFPNWWGTAPMAVWTFLESSDLSGKIVIPFCTHGGGGEQNCFKDFKQHIGTAIVRKGFSIHGGNVNAARPQVEKWLQEVL